MEDLSGQTLKGYKLLELIGVGGYGALYRALQSTTNREVALKIIQPEVSSQPEFIRRFDIEAQMIARLEHLHIVPLYDFWRDPGGAYLVMRWLRGGSLGEALEKGPLDLPAAVRLVDQIASSLTTAHNNRIIHHDLKPSNILLDEEGNAYLSDFGIAKDLSQPVKNSRSEEVPIGSLDYLSPEQARGQEITPKTDLYSLGVTLYETLTGKHPFLGISSVERRYKHINELLPMIESLDPTVTEGINEVIQKATAKDPARRYNNALDMAAAFRLAARMDDSGNDLLLEETLTQREQEILTHIVAGHSNKQIATALFIELPTVKWHITQLYRKMGVRSRAQASVRARELDLIQDAEREKSFTGTISTSLPKPINPYKGLRPFKAADSQDFFGREALIEKLLERLQERDERARFLAILGPSGSGKSSLLSAGLVPAIWAGKLPDSERWFVVELTPGVRPLDELEVALTRIAAEQADNLHKHLHRDAGGLHRAASLILPRDESQLLLVIDQFEELFILTENEAVRDHFMDLIYHAVSDPRSRIRVVIAMRADFYDKPLYHHHFGKLLRNRMETLLPLSAEELERAIVQPARHVGVTFETGLPTRIIEEMLYQPGALPLLQYALTELFESRNSRVLTQRAYDDIGGAVGALAQRADEVYLEFDHAGREAARQMFLRLINLGEGLSDGTYAPDIRRRIPQAELLTLVDDPDVMEEVIDTFGAYRILSLDHDSVSRQPILELAHEALIHEWYQLEAWLVESRDDLLQYRRFQALAEEWIKTGRDHGYLLRETRLDQFAGWVEHTDLTLTPDERAYLKASLQAREMRRDEDEERRKRELRTAQKLAETEKLRAEENAGANRRLRWLAAGLAVFLFAALGGALYAWGQSRRAIEQAQIAFVRELAAEAVGNLGVDPDLSIHLALQAVQVTYENEGFVLPVAEEALHRAIQSSRIAYTFPQSGGLAFSPDGLHLVIGDMDGSIHIWDTRNGEPVDSLTGHAEAVTSIAFSPDGRLLATASADHNRIVWEYPEGRQVLNLPGSDEPALTAGLSKVDFSPNGEYLLSTAQFEEAGIWDIASGQEIVHFDESAGPTGDFSPDGKNLALMTAVWDVSNILELGAGAVSFGDTPTVVAWRERLYDYADPFIEFRATSSNIESAYQEPGSVSYSPDGRYLLTTVISSQAVMRNAETGEPLFILSGHTNIINGTAYSPDGISVATASADRTARVWDAKSGQTMLVLEGHQDEVIQVAFSPDGGTLATSSLDGTTKLWDITASGSDEWQNRNLGGGLVRLSSNPQRSHPEIEWEQDLVDTFDFKVGKNILASDNSHGAIIPAISPDGSLMALSNEEGNVHLFDAANGDWVHSFQLDRIVSTLIISPEGDLLFIGGDGTLSIIDLNTKDLLVRWIVQDGFVNSLGFEREDNTLILAGAEGNILFIDLETILPNHPSEGTLPSPQELPPHAVELSIPGHSDVITHLEASPDGRNLLTSSWDGTARVWDASNGSLLLTLTGHKGRVWHAAFHPDGERIATAGADGSVILWDAESGEQLFVLNTQPMGIYNLSFSRDGRFLAASSTDGSVRVYTMSIDDLIVLAKERLTRELSDAECQRYFHVERCP